MAKQQTKTQTTSGKKKALAKLLVVHGTISNPDKSPASGLKVIAFDQDETGKDRLGEAVTDAAGHYRVEYDAGDFRHSKNEKGGADVCIRVYGTQGALLFAGNTVRNAPANLRMNATLPAVQFVVRGHVIGGHKGQLVRAYDVDLRSEELLGHDFIEADGAYEIPYSPRKFRRGEIGAADLRVSVRLRHDELSSDVFFNADSNKTINLEIKKEAPPPASEFERNLADLAPALKTITLLDIDGESSDQKTKDLDFLAGDSGIDHQQIAWLVQAAGYEAKAKSVASASRTHANDFSLPSAAFYGWFRENLPTDLETLVSKSIDELMTALKSAIDRRVIPAIPAAGLKRIADSLNQLKLERTLSSPPPRSGIALGDLLATLASPPAPNQQRALAAAIGDLHADDPNLVERIGAIKGFDGDAAAVARTVRLGALTANNLSLAQTLQDRLEKAKENDGSLRPLATVHADEWIDLAYAHGTPDGMSVTPDQYASDLATKIEHQHPTDTLAIHLAAGGALSRHPLLSGVAKFLHDNPEFDIASANINAIGDEHKLPHAAVDRAGLSKGLQALQRLKTLGASWRDTATLLDNDFVSPHQILAAGPTQLSAVLDGQLPPERIAALHAQAAELHNVTFAVVTAALSPLSAPDVLPDASPTAGPAPKGPVGIEDLPRVLKAQGARINPNDYKSLGPVKSDSVSHIKNTLNFDNVVEFQPTLQALFGSQDACSCCHCGSVLGPPAYFVDLLQFVANGAQNSQLLDRLLHRRPDLQDIELTCSNANTEVPAIDLALELLENAVALPLDIDLPTGQTLDDQLSNGQPVGDAVRAALERTVRSLSGDVQATWAGANGDGTIDWIVVDRHRRWSLNALAEDSLIAKDDARGLRRLDTSGLNLTALIQALDAGKITADARALFARLIAPNQNHEFSDYQITITPITLGRSWRIAFRIVVELTIDTTSGQLTLQIPNAKPWLNKHYDAKTIAALERDLKKGVPELVRVLISDRFPGIGALSAKAGESKRGKVWKIVSAQRTLTLDYTPAHLKIVSLAYQSGDPDADPVAEPENHNPEAYERLKGAQFPWTLPLDLPLEEVRAFLERARSSRRQLMELLLPTDETFDSDLATEWLGASDAEVTLIATEAAAPEVYDYWGIPTAQGRVFDAASGRYLQGSSLSLLKNVSILLQQARIDFAELQALIATAFVTRNGDAPLVIIPPFSCKPSEMAVPQLTGGHLDRLHRFIRLRRRLGWTIHELDLAIGAFGGEVNSDTLTSLALLKRLQRELGLRLPELVGSLGRLETTTWTDYLRDETQDRQSLYVTIFQREAVRKSADFAEFSLRADALELQNPVDGGISAHAEYIGSCVVVDAAVIAEWVAAGSPLGIVDRLDIENLSRVTGAAYLCRALGMDSQQLSHLIELLGSQASPFRAGLSARERLDATLDLVERQRNLSHTDVSAETLRYVLQNYDVPGSSVTLSTIQRSQLIESARAAARSIPDSTDTAATDAAAQAAVTQLAREDAVIAALASALGAASTLMDALLRKRLRHPSDGTQRGIDAFLDANFTTTEVAHSPTAPIPPAVSVPAALKASVDAADAAAEDLIVRLYKTIFLCTVLKLTATDLDLISAPPAVADGFTALDFNSLPVANGAPVADFPKYEQLAALARLRSFVTNGSDLLHRYILPADASVAWSVAGARSALATGFDLPTAEIDAAADALGITAAPQHRDPIALTRLINLLKALKSLGATVALAKDLTSTSPDESIALDARELLRSKFGDGQWHDLIKPIEDKLRTRQRDALVDFLIARDELRDADDLYETYLIDVQTGSCMNTTRLLQATAAVQLFVQRVLLNLEPGASLGADKRDLWEWMRSYRVWEANRKVFLFPENYLLPELRDDKTALFREMEGALSESEPTQDSMRGAVLGFLDGLNDLAQVSVISMYEDEQLIGNPPAQVLQATLYAIGRTPNQPYRYFWRTCSRFGDAQMSWSGWEPLELDNANDYLMPFTFEGDMHLAWPVFRKTKNKDDENLLEWEVQLAWTRRTSKGWIKRKLSNTSLTVSRLPNKDETASFVFRLAKDLTPSGYVDDDGNPLMRETIRIACFAASERNPINTTRADGSIDMLKHMGDRSNDQNGNTTLAISGILFDYATVDRESTTIKRALPNVWVTAYYQNHFRDNDPGGDVRTLSKTVYTDSSGAFNLTIDTLDPSHNNQDDSHHIGVYNGSAVRLQFGLFDGSAYLERYSEDLGGSAFGLFKSWTWKINVGMERDEIRNLFDPSRAVDFLNQGAFVIEPGRDVRFDSTWVTALSPAPNLLADVQQSISTLPMDIDGNRFAANTAPPIENVDLDTDGAVLPSSFIPSIEAPVSVTHATQSVQPASLVESSAWYLKDKRAGYYLLKQFGAWSCWPDGQRFASDYRVVAALSLQTVFTRSVESWLVDPAVDNFSRAIPYANYNWELFLHVPLAIADFLASQQRFEDARQWLHAVFDPTTDKVIGGVPQFWRFLPFANGSQPDGIAKLLTWLADPTSGDPAIENALTSEIDQWKHNPFTPHLIARLRPSAYQWYAFFAYVTVLIQWGDQLFRRDTRESVNEATLLYVLAAKLLGPRPRTIRQTSPLPPQTYRSLSASGLDDFSNSWVEYADLPGLRRIMLAAQSGQTSSASSFNDIDKRTGYQTHETGTQLLTSFALAFCIPQNDKLTEFYDLVERRLFDIRHCRNIDGVVRELPLYDPPIDPLLLIRARAAGLDIASVIADLYAPLPNYRLAVTLQKAVELCSEVKSLGGALLAALEKQDAENLSLLRSTQEIAMLKLARDVRQKQVDEADANIVALQQSQAMVTERFAQFQKLLGQNSITKGQDGLPVVEQSSSLTVSTDAVGGASGLALSRLEVQQLQYAALAHLNTQIAGAVQVVAGVISLIPNIFAGTPFAGQTSGGTNWGIGANAIARSVEMIAAEANYLASQAGSFGGFERRQDDWVYQSRLALAELKQLDKQILAAQIRRDIAQKELDNHDRQIANANEIDDFMRSKFTNNQLFRWMSSQLSDVYFRTYELALDQARRAERCYRHELGLDDSTAPFIQSDNWDSLKRGLLAGERLHHDLKRLESTHLDRNVREFELTRHVSLLQLDPMALITLRETGACDFEIPEALFDLDCPGHYMRRIRMVSLSIPCVAGPYSSVSATLRLTKSETRVKVTADDYARLPPGQDDSRFRSSSAPIMSIVTSSSQQDSGMFEANLRDERYLPFEGAGAISTWRLELPSELRQFDYDTINDVVLHVRYTSRYGGDEFRNDATDNLSTQIGKAEAAGMTRLFSIRHEFPSAWAKFIAVDIDGANTVTAELSLDLRPEHYPFWAQGRLSSVTTATVIARVADGLDNIVIDEEAAGTGQSDHLSRPTDPNVKSLLTGTLTKLAPKLPVTEAGKPFKLYFEENAIEDLWIAISWKGPAV